MATIIIDGRQFTAPDGKRLVQALEDNGVDILHRCGGMARCTTCRVTFNRGEPDFYHPREEAKLDSIGELGSLRLSCHVLCEGTMDVNVLETLSKRGLSDPGPRPTDTIPPLLT